MPPVENRWRVSCRTTLELCEQSEKGKFPGSSYSVSQTKGARSNSGAPEKPVPPSMICATSTYSLMIEDERMIT